MTLSPYFLENKEKIKMNDIFHFLISSAACYAGTRESGGGGIWKLFLSTQKSTSEKPLKLHDMQGHVSKMIINEYYADQQPI